nr:DNA topoisomerase 2-like [Tanacetum cinerariifolium]
MDLARQPNGKKTITFVPGPLYKIFDEILVNAADNKQRDPKMDDVNVNIDVAKNMISVWNNGDGIPVEMHQGEVVYVPELIFGHLLTSSNYDDLIKKTTGARNGYGAKLANIFSTEFTIETADGKRNKRYKQVFTNNMAKKSEPTITKCKNSENWTMVSFKPDLAKFGMECLEDDTVALMKRRVIDLAGYLGKGENVSDAGRVRGSILSHMKTLRQRDEAKEQNHKEWFTILKSSLDKDVDFLGEIPVPSGFHHTIRKNDVIYVFRSTFNRKGGRTKRPSPKIFIVRKGDKSEQV